MAEPGALRLAPAAPWGVSWIAPTPGYMRRASHALAHQGRVWLVDPVDGPGLDGELERLGRVAGVLRLLDRHGRDARALAARHDAPLLGEPVDDVPGAPFRCVPLTRRRWWRETALWWAEHGVLVVPESVGTGPYHRAPGRRIGVHPALRLTPPRALLDLAPRALLAGHGDPLVDGDVAGDLHAAVRGARREVPRWLASLPGALRRG